MIAHNTPFGDINDSEDDLQPLVLSMTRDAVRALRLFAGLMADCEVNSARMAERANSDFLTVTELADTLVRSENLIFSEAHHFVSEAVRRLQGTYSPEGMLDSLLSLRPFSTPREVLAKALDAANFIAVRRIPGGPAPEMVRAAIDEAEKDADSTKAWIAAKATLLEDYPKRIAAARETLFKEV